MSKIKEFFITVWCCITFPYNWLISRKFEKRFTEYIEKDKKSMITEKDLECLKSLGVEIQPEQTPTEIKKRPD